jgi:tetratricopeptide (TPR) repeat protein
VAARQGLGFTYRELAEIAAQQGQDAAPSYENAIGAYSKALELDATRARVWGDRGTTYQAYCSWLKASGTLRPDLCEKAIEDFTRALQLDGRYGVARNNRGLAYMCRGERASEFLKLAEEDFSQALREYPNFCEARMNLGRLYRFQGRWLEALSSFEEAQRISGHETPELRKLLDEAREKIR